ncbi:peptidoglycan DD-metalloendopeptidase family protein [Benzoatithermus flavus]|uniref:Peptidoglycan DD-metalloendopeptidase family protein n=1 Tax=Benzoatithermus flavus TaxID=3108223 RepID=A0ABU8XTQ8_9PROT
MTIATVGTGKVHLPENGVLELTLRAEHVLSGRADPVAAVVPAAEAATLPPTPRAVAPRDLPPAAIPRAKPVDQPAAAEMAAPARAEVEVQRGDTLLDILTRAGIESVEAQDAVSSLRKVTNLRRLRIGQRLALEVEPGEGQRLARLVLPVDAAKEVHLVREEDGSFAARSVERPLQREMVRVRAAIADSVYEAARDAGLPAAIMGQMIKLLSWDVDFQRDVHPGDRFESVFERRVNEKGEMAAAGDLLFVGLDTQERRIEAYRYTTSDGRTSFFDRDGRALRKWLLKTPIDGARLTSTFGMRRHPVLGYTRMHKGIDFAAPPGTPILAAGDGEIEFAGRSSGYGKYVRIRHSREYSTAYAHMSRFAPGLRRGKHVRQGEVIGYVGTTGLSTGPHLHYELLVNGEQVNPLSVKVALTDRLQGAELKRFLALRAEIDKLRRRPDSEQMIAQRMD